MSRESCAPMQLVRQSAALLQSVAREKEEPRATFYCYRQSLSKARRASAIPLGSATSSLIGGLLGDVFDQRSSLLPSARQAGTGRLCTHDAYAWSPDRPARKSRASHTARPSGALARRFRQSSPAWADPAATSTAVRTHTLRSVIFAYPLSPSCRRGFRPTVNHRIYKGFA
jgi:hypothetical protein